MKNVLKRTVLALAVISAFAVNMPQTYAQESAEFDIVVYVSPAGEKDGDGSFEKPFATPEQARDAVRALRKASDEALSAKIVLRGGIYERDESFELTKEDSGTAEKPTLLTAYPGEEVRLSGAARVEYKVDLEPEIEERLPEEVRDKVLAFDLKKNGLDGLMEFEQMYYSIAKKATADVLWDGEYCHVARWPNEGFAKVKTVAYTGFKLFVTEGVVHPRDDDVGFVFTSDAPNVEKWINAKDDAWLFGYWQNGWATDSVRIKHISGNKVFTKTSVSFGVKRGGKYYIFNLPEELDSPGEWYINNKTGIMYIYPMSEYNEDTEITITKLNEPLIKCSNVSYLTIENMTVQSGMSSGIDIADCTNVQVAGCTIKQFVKNAVNIKNSLNSGVLSSEVEQIGAAGISINSGNRSKLEAMGCYAVNNNVHDFGRVEKTYYPGIEMSGVGNYMAYNEIHNAPHMALRAEGNNNIIEFNEIYDVVKETKDAGAFYTCRDQLAFGNIMRYNYYHDIYGGSGEAAGTAVGFYVDDVGCAWTCYGNIFNKVDHPILIGGGSNNKVINNLILNAPEENTEYAISVDRRDSWSNIMSYATSTLGFADYQNEVWQKWYPEAYNIRETLEADGVVLPRNNVIKNNVIINHAAVEITEIAKELGTVENNLEADEIKGITVDENGRVTIAEDSELYDLMPQFQSIPTEKIGLYNDRYRSNAK